MNNIAFNIALPLLTAFLLPIISTGSKSAARFIGPFVLLAMLWFAAAYLNILEHPVAIALGGFLPPLGVSFHLDNLSLLMASIIPLMMLLLWPYSNSEGYREESLLLLLAGAASGLALSGDLFNIYVFYELLSVASFGLAAANRTAASFAATFRYVVISGLGTVLALTGIALIYTQTGTLNLAHIGLLASQLNNPVGLSAFALIVIGIGVKAEIFPVNGWVPEVYSTASPRISALLAGLVSKLAVLVIIRLLVVAYQGSEAYNLLLVLGILGIIWGELSAWRSKDLKRMLSFSSIGQLGMVLVAFSIPGEAGMVAGIAMMLHHLVVKPGLFMLTENWNASIKKLGGAAKSSPLAALLFMLFALSLIGVPPL
ncbi:MAG: NADH-quinone oxidoreductase subunit J, partial [Gammaproteobacteria bacterium]|nr:NADH-quinone oxidoreductase subunit J [Gammaproteobacteria bacterium]